jgi:hypothetical protein
MSAIPSADAIGDLRPRVQYRDDSGARAYEVVVYRNGVTLGE